MVTDLLDHCGAGNMRTEHAIVLPLPIRKMHQSIQISWNGRAEGHETWVEPHAPLNRG